jgi:hypothetical protein
MRTLIKILLTFAALVACTPIFAVVQEVPLLKLVLIAGLIAGIRAIWKYSPEKTQQTTNDMTVPQADIHQLDKN